MADPAPVEKLYWRTAALGGVLLVALTPFDQSLALYLQENSWPQLTEFFEQSLFEGEPFGITDLVNFCLIAVLMVFGLGFLPGGAWAKVWRQQCGFVLLASLVMGLGVVHGLKYSLARVRPYDLGETLSFTPWFFLGDHSWGERFHGSFPSGHTGTMIGLLLLLPFCRTKQQQDWLLLSAVGLALLMGVTRVMAKAHWPTDVAGAIFLAGIVFAGVSRWLPGRRS